MTQPAPHPDADDLAQELAGYRIQWRRYRRTLRFFAWLIARIVWWELALRWLVGESRIGPGRVQRMQRWARDFCALAVDMGGVMIKLGQFISSRADILPPEVIQVLAALQDEVPTVAFDVIRQTLDLELGPPEERFGSFDTTPIAAASLGQAHRATLPDGTRVVVKVQRPGIGSLVYTDLKALGVVAGWMMKFPLIRHRADVPALLDEFSAVLWDELNYTLEANNAETFAAMFADNMGIYIPRLYRDYSTRRVVTLEDVTAIKITDYDGLTAAGIDRRDVARRLINTYLWMVFIRRFFHADPHPGNLFVYPLPPDVPASTGQHPNGTPLEGGPFYLIFVDFGMVGRLTPEIVAGLRETLIALTTRDAHRLVKSYQELGILLPGADLERIEQATRATFDRVWGLNLSQISTMPLSDMADLGREFSDLLLSLPFQVPQDFLYLSRCVGILTGICTGLDPGFDPWREVYPFVQTLLVEDGEVPFLTTLPDSLTLRDLVRPETVRAALARENVEFALNTGLDLARRLVQLPALADDVLRRADRGDLTVRITPAPDLTREIRRLEHAAQRVTAAVIFAGLAVSSALLYTAGEHTISAIGFGLAGITFLRVLFVH
jgi:predicted unusual protein kinase regulating ubiquinone biosynthesis (AarF/ABC1/UbiB family)